MLSDVVRVALPRSAPLDPDTLLSSNALFLDNTVWARTQKAHTREGRGLLPLILALGEGVPSGPRCLYAAQWDDLTELTSA